MYNTTNQYNYRPLNFISQTNKCYVDSYTEVACYQLPPNASYIFIDKTKPLIYEKMTDAYGNYTIKTFTLTEVADDNKDDTVTKSDLQSIVARLEALENKDAHEEV